MAALRLFSYLPNPRLMKATIAARLCGVEIEIRGDRPDNLSNWLWDFEARPLIDADGDRADIIAKTAHTGFGKKLYKTEQFLKTQPFGTVPAAFSPDGTMGIWESNSILRAVARLGREKLNLYGSDAYEASRIDSFLDSALVFARQSQIYLLALSKTDCTTEIRDETAKSFNIFLKGIDAAVSDNTEGMVNNKLSIADICFACEVCQVSRERAHLRTLADNQLEKVCDFASLKLEFPNAMAHFDRLINNKCFSPDISPLMDKLAKREIDFKTPD